MRTRPEGADLLQAAQVLLRERLLGDLPQHRRHEALMICNAMKIAARQLRFGEQPQREELHSLLALLQEERVGLLAGNRLLAMRLREGFGDPGQSAREQVLAHLRSSVGQAVAESSPDYLKQ
ncbi:DUF6285 domain-containing protein [Pseudomonas sp. NPDC086251]|uniref:DUF6285 domain-containing protein n=1 Tax=Pseudomonas sp. NPDC086251 TaxID=3364431 RepID=UPI003834D36B